MLRVKSSDLIGKLLAKLFGLRPVEADGIAGVTVKCVNISKNTKCEGILLERA